MLKFSKLVAVFVVDYVPWTGMVILAVALFIVSQDNHDLRDSVIMYDRRQHVRSKESKQIVQDMIKDMEDIARKYSLKEMGMR